MQSGTDKTKDMEWLNIWCDDNILPASWERNPARVVAFDNRHIHSNSLGFTHSNMSHTMHQSIPRNLSPISCASTDLLPILISPSGDRDSFTVYSEVCGV